MLRKAQQQRAYGGGYENTPDVYIERFSRQLEPNTKRHKQQLEERKLAFVSKTDGN